MAIIVRTFNLWTHISAESTLPRQQIYFSPGSSFNKLHFSQKEFDFEAWKKKHNISIQKIYPFASVQEYNLKTYLKDKKKPEDIAGIYIEFSDQSSISIPFSYSHQLNDKIYYSIDKELTSNIIYNHYQIKKDNSEPENLLRKEKANNIINYLCNNEYLKKTTGVGYTLTSTLHSYNQVEVIEPADKITLPTKENDYTYGLNETKFFEYVHRYERLPFNKSTNNCADHILRALKEAADENLKTQDTLTKFEEKTFIKFFNLRIRNPNIWILGKTVGDYARKMREIILQKKIEDPDNKLSMHEKVKQVINMEIDRLNDGIINIGKNSLFSLFRSYSAKQKLNKLHTLVTMRDELKGIEPSDKQAIVNLVDELIKNPIIQQGITRHHTLDHLKSLYQQIDNAHKQENLKRK